MSRDLRKEASESLRTAANSINGLDAFSAPEEIKRALTTSLDALCLVAAIVGVPNAIEPDGSNPQVTTTLE